MQARSSLRSSPKFDLTVVFSNDFLHGEALLIFGRLCDILVFEKLVGLFAGKCNENLKLFRRAMKVGYARVSTHDQHVALQLDALRKAGCRQLYEEVISGARADRPVLQQALAHLRQGDVLMIWKLDRLGRSLRHLIEVVSDLAQRGIGFKSLQENLDTTTSSGKLVFHMFGALAEFERDLIRERTQAGLSAARARGRLGGRPRGLSRQAEATALAADTLYREGHLSVQQIAEKLHIAKSTLYVYLRHRGVAIGALQQPLLPSPAPPRSRPSSTPPARRTGTAHTAGHA
jgi:DNA invertase Pin-like site-specific DNA recombinase